MSKKLILIFVTLFFLQSHFVFAADVIINEFVSDPSSGPEWVELLNTSSSSVDLSGWTWTELASPGGDTEHENSPKSLSGTISAGGVFVFEMNSALNNTGDSIGLYNGTNLEDRATFGKVNNYSKDLDVPTKGKSGAYINGGWQTNQEPTKNTQNPNSPSSGGGINSDGGTNSSTSSSETTTETKPKIVAQKIKVEITAQSLVYVGIPFVVLGKVFGTTGEQMYSGKYYWNFGDGDSRETKVLNVDKFNHTYYYPGEYTLLLEHYSDVFTNIPDATEKLIIKVVMPEISISSVGNGKDFYVEIANNADYDADLSNWFLLSSQKSFLIPHNTILAAGNKMIISSNVTHFSIEDKNTLKLMTPPGEVAFDYSASTMPTKRISQNVVSFSNNYINKNEPTIIEDSFVSQNVSGTASVIDSGVGEKEKGFLSGIPIISVVFIGASASVVYFIRRKKVARVAGDDFEILDE